MVTPGAKRDAAMHAQAAFGLSERRATLSASAAVWRAIVRPGPMIRLCASGYANWPLSAAGSVIGVWGIFWPAKA